MALETFWEQILRLRFALASNLLNSMRAFWWALVGVVTSSSSEWFWKRDSDSEWQYAVTDLQVAESGDEDESLMRLGTAAAGLKKSVRYLDEPEAIISYVFSSIQICTF